VARRERRKGDDGSLGSPGAQRAPGVEQPEKRRVGKALESRNETRVGLGVTTEARQSLDESGERARIVGRHFDQALVLNESFLDEAAAEEQACEVTASGGEARVDAQRIVVALGRLIGAAFAFGQHSERVMRLRDVGVVAERSLAQEAGPREVAALELDETEVHERLDEAGAVLERHTEASVRRLEVAVGERLDPRCVQGCGLRWEGSTGRAAGEKRDDPGSHTVFIGPAPGSVSCRDQHSLARAGLAWFQEAPMATESDQDLTDAPDEEEERRERRPVRKKKPKPPVPTDEREIDAPDKLTLSMLGVMGVVTLALWVFARAACNYHPPRETRRPRAVKIEDLAREPKDAALEMQQRLTQLDFDGATQLATGDAGAEVTKAKAACMTKPQECAMRRKQLEKSVESTAALLERSQTDATVRVTTVRPGGKDVTLDKLQRVGSIWKVVSRGPDDPNFKPRPPDMPTLQLLAAPPPMAIPSPPHDDDD
jgi:hypothetical protein